MKRRSFVTSSVPVFADVPNESIDSVVPVLGYKYIHFEI